MRKNIGRKRGFRAGWVIALGILAGCQETGLEFPPGEERVPEQFGLRVEWNPGFVARGILAGNRAHYGRAYAEEGTLQFRVATVRNLGREEIEFFPTRVRLDRPVVELHHRMWSLVPRHVNSADMANTFQSEAGESLVDYRADFEVEEARVVFRSGGSAAFPPEWEGTEEKVGIRIRPGEVAEIRWNLRLRPETPLVPSAPPPAGFTGMDRAVSGYFPPEIMGRVNPAFRVEALIAHGFTVYPALRIAAREIGADEIHPLRMEESVLKPATWTDADFAQKLSMDVPLKSVRYQIPRLPILL